METLDFDVNIGEQQLIQPETPTPKEIKYLSNIDDQMGLRNHIPFIHVYPPPPPQNHAFTNPSPLIRQALSLTLVPYYPIAGRLRNGDKGKLVVDCNAEGIIYREASTNLSVKQLNTANGGNLHPPFHHLDRFLVDDIWGCNSITDSPLLRVQVTHFACGGFILAYTFNHCICDSFGAHQFISAVAELARNHPTLTVPSILPSWSRHVLSPRFPPKFSYPLPEYDEVDHRTGVEVEFRNLTQTSVFLSRSDVASLKRKAGGGSTFNAVASCLWKARTRALSLKGRPARLLFPVDTRARHLPRLPETYYGAAVVFPCVTLKAEEVMDGSMEELADLIEGGKKTASEDEYRRSTVDFIEANGRRGFCGGEEVFLVSDVSRLRFANVDFGWGKGLYGGPARAGTGAVPGMVTSLVACRRDGDDVDGIVALVSLPLKSVDKFREEVRKIVMGGYGSHDLLMSAL